MHQHLKGVLAPDSDDGDGTDECSDKPRIQVSTGLEQPVGADTEVRRAHIIPRQVLCLDADSFFLNVHRRADPSLDDTQPLVLHQHQDVICANEAAKSVGVKKHMRPSEARAKLGARGRFVHAYYRDWPGPRVWIEPYQEASRELFAVVRAALGTQHRFERASIDECYVELGLTAGVEPAQLVAELRATVELHASLPVSIGVGPNKLVAKLAATAAKQQTSKIVIVDTPDSLVELLAVTPASRLPQLGTVMS